MLKAQTKYFGEIEYSEDMVLTLPDGLFGFENERSFLLLPFSGEGSLFSLQSLQTPALSFVAMDPFTLDAGYTPVLQPEELRALGVTDSQHLYYYVLCAIRHPVSNSTLNFRCPIVINGDTRQAMQVILDDERYEMRCPLSQFGVGHADEEAAPC